MRRAHNVDANQAAIVEALRRVGATVQILSAVGGGCVDLMVGYRNKTYCLEVKQPGKAADLTEDERAWHLFWRGHAAIVTTPESALRAIGVEYQG